MRETTSPSGASHTFIAGGSVTVPVKPAAQEVPLLDLGAQWTAIRDEALAAITRVCDSQRFILGAEVEAFEREIAAAIGVEHAVGMSSPAPTRSLRRRDPSRASALGPSWSTSIPSVSTSTRQPWRLR